MENIKLTKFYEEPKQKYKLISVVLFRLETSYKDSNKYYNGLNLLINNFQKYFPNFYLRIYYDTSVINNFEDKHKNDTIKL